jgi:rhodanese-related sulfurtransferase
MKRMISAVLIILLLFTGCGGNSMEQNSYQQITQDVAKEMMDAGDVVILDVREQYEYDAGHITGAVLLPVGSITEDAAAAVIDDLETVVLVYCRSGNRSKTASQALVDLGYTKIYEFGGINTWPYEIEK